MATTTKSLEKHIFLTTAAATPNFHGSLSPIDIRSSKNPWRLAIGPSFLRWSGRSGIPTLARHRRPKGCDFGSPSGSRTKRSSIRCHILWQMTVECRQLCHITPWR
jgi:hypothetical protein